MKESIMNERNYKVYKNKLTTILRVAEKTFMVNC